MDTFVHHEGRNCLQDGPVYVCLGSNTTQPIRVEVIPSLTLPDQDTFPTKDDAEDLQYQLFKTNSKLLELINQHVEFEAHEQKGHEANLEVESGLRTLMFAEVGIIAIIGIAQYLLLRRFTNNLKFR